MRVVASFILLFALSAATDATAPIGLQPSGPWKIDYGERSCVLTRPFSAAGQVYEFELTFAPIERSAWLRIGSSEKVKGRDDGDTIVEIDGKRLAETVHFNIFPNAKGGTTREFLFDDFRKDIGAATTTVRLTPRRFGDFNVAVPGFPEAMRAMDVCIDDLHRSLGVDPAVLRAVATEPVGDAFSFLKFPETQNGLDIALLYWVTAAGRVDDCRVVLASGNRDFDNRVCDELKRNGRFKPARDASGAPIRAPVYEYIPLRRAEFISNTPL